MQTLEKSEPAWESRNGEAEPFFTSSAGRQRYSLGAHSPLPAEEGVRERKELTAVGLVVAVLAVRVLVAAPALGDAAARVAAVLGVAAGAAQALGQS